jgi:DNA-binding CsgD family transcriptional regulator/PAS domain-containing protein
MSLTLTTDDLARCEEASRILLSPLSPPSVEAWRGEVCRAVRTLLRADYSLFVLPGAARPLFSEDLDPATLAAHVRYIAPSMTGGCSEDPHIHRYFDRRRQLGVDTATYAVIDRVIGRAWRDTAFYNEVLQASGMRDMAACYAALPDEAAPADAAAAVYYERPDASPFGEGSLLLLQALLPSFRAGLDVLVRCRAHGQALDQLSEPVCVCTIDGRALYRNAALVRLLDAEPERERVEEALHAQARALCRVGYPRRHAEPVPFAPGMQEVSVRRGRYVLRGTLLPHGTFGPEGRVMISVAPPSQPTLPPHEVLRARYGFTRREAEVALLLAEGLTNSQLAERLFLSPHTTRKHAERVLEKLDLRTRKALALRLMQDDAA